MTRPGPEPWGWVETDAGRAVLDALRDADRTSARTIERCRSLASPDVVQAALALLDARARAAGKLDRADALLLDRTAVEQSTSTDVARVKAQRFRAAGVTTVVDLCCGIGGDAIGFALEGIAPVLVDREFSRARAARTNLSLFGGSLARPPGAVVADVASPALLPTGAEDTRAPVAFHLDPDRRPDGRRSWNYADLLPGPDAIQRWLATGAPGAVKLGPGVDFAQLPSQTPTPGGDPHPTEIEVIQRGRGLVQTVLWSGACAHVPRRATRIDASGVVSLTGDEVPVLIAEPPAVAELFGSPPPPATVYLHIVEPAIERAGLLGTLAAQHDLRLPHEHAGFLWGPAPIASPWLRPVPLRAMLPARVPDVRRVVKDHGLRITGVRARGGDRPDEWEKKLRAGLRGGEGPRVTIHRTRDGARMRAWITDEVPAEPPAA